MIEREEGTGSGCLGNSRETTCKVSGAASTSSLLPWAHVVPVFVHKDRLFLDSFGCDLCVLFWRAQFWQQTSA